MSPDGSALLAAGPVLRPDRTEIWDLRTGKRLVRKLGDPGSPTFSRDGRHVIFGASGLAEVISLPDLRHVRPDPDVLRPTELVERSADGQYVLSWDSTPPTVVSVLTGEAVAELRGPGLDTRTFGFIGDGAGVLTTDDAASTSPSCRVGRPCAPSRNGNRSPRGC